MNGSTSTSWTLVYHVGIWREVKLRVSCWICKDRDGIVMVLASSVQIAVSGNCTFRTRRVCKMQFLTRYCNDYPMFSLHVSGLRIYSGESVNVKNWNLVKRKRAMVSRLEYRDTTDNLLERNNINFSFFLPLETLTRDPARVVFTAWTNYDACGYFLPLRRLFWPNAKWKSTSPRYKN